MGYLSGSRFNLVVSLRYAPEPGETAFLCELFGKASQILSDATDGALSVGRVDIATDGRGGADADLWIHPADTVWPNSTGARLWFPGESMDFAQDYLMYPTVLVHELGHYLFGLRDEYASSGAACVGKLSQQASIMERYGWGFQSRWIDGFGDGFTGWSTFFPAYTAHTAVFRAGQPTEFCHPGNHDPAAAHPQNLANGGQSCWSYIALDANHNGIPYGLNAPGRAGPRKRKPAAPPATICSTLASTQRSLLVLGPGQPSLGGLDPIRTGANFWIDVARVSEQLGVTTGTGGPGLGPVITPVPTDPDAQEAWRRSRRSEVEARPSPESEAHLGPPVDRLRVSLGEITRGGRTATQQLVLAAADLGSADLESLLGLLPEIRAAGVRLDILASGDEPRLGVLAQVAFVTGGRLIAPAAGGLLASAPVADALIALALERRENGSLVGVEGGSSAGFARARLARERGDGVRFGLDVSAGSSLATIGAAWAGAAGAFDVAVLDPGGARVEAGRGVQSTAGTDRYAFLQVDDPMPGRWTVQVTGPGATDAGVHPIGAQVNERLRLDATLVQAHVREGEPIHLRARIRAPYAVPGATVVAHVQGPDGHVEELTFTEHRGAHDDPHEPFTYTATVETADRGAGVYAVEVVATRPAGPFDLAVDDLYALRPGLGRDRLKESIDLPAIHLRALLTAVADAEGRTADDPIAGFSPVEAQPGVLIAE